MKSNNNKVSAQFSAKFSGVLTKFKDSSTVQIGHQQLKSLFGQFTFKDIFTSFISKMDNSDQLNQRQKKQYGKVYITFIDSYKDQILFDQYFDKLMESINKKQYGVNQVIGHVSKTILSRIQIPQNLYPYVNLIINIFHHHFQIAKILKQIIDSIASIIIKEMQDDIIGIILQKINSSKSKSQFMDVILSLVLCLEQNLTVQNQVYNLIIKNLKNDDWSCRKICVDISYAMLVIKKQISSTIHNILKQLKYDKIKHVRDSVNNYQTLYKQIVGQEIPKSNTSIITKKRYNSPTQRTIHKSPKNLTQRQMNPTRDKSSSSIDKNLKKQKNQNFFKNAKNNDIIVIQQQNKSMIEIKNQSQEIKDMSSSAVNQQVKFKLQLPQIKQSTKNFETYLQDRKSPKTKESKSPLIRSNSPRTRPNQQLRYDRLKRLNFNQKQPKKITKFNYESEFQQFKKKNRSNQAQQKKNAQQQMIQSVVQQSFMKNRPQIHISQLSARTQSSQIEQIKNLFFNFQNKIFEKIDKMQKRIQLLQKQRYDSNNIGQKSPSFQPVDIKYKYQSQKSIQTPKGLQNSIKIGHEISYRLQSPRNSSLNESINESKWQNSDFQGIQSNLQQKIRISMINQNWDQAFTIALTNNKKNIILSLFQKCVFPRDKTVQQCILLQIKKLLNYISTLKWLKYYLMQRQMSFNRLHKLKEELIRKGTSDNRNYEMMKQLLLNQIQEQIKKTHLQSQF